VAISKRRAMGYESCPGCMMVDARGKDCEPGNASYCPIAWFNSTKRILSHRTVSATDQGSSDEGLGSKGW
jgi:hypothetical protein